MLPLVDELLAELEKHARDPAGYGACSRGEEEFWDDRCLAHFLRGICLRYVAHPDPDALLDAGEEEEVRACRAESERGAREAFEAVFRDGPKVVYDHYLVYYARESSLVPLLFGCPEWPFCFCFFFGSGGRGARTARTCQY